VSRRQAAVLVALTIALGLASRKVHLDNFVWDKSLGDVLYTVMVYFFLALGRPSTRPHVLGVAAFGISFVIELFQATGIPARLPRILQIVLGTSFAWHDVACYVVGALAVALADAFLIRKKAGASAASPPT
jgi:hypothetical protein